MSDFNQKLWLDCHVVPLLNGTPRIAIHYPFWNGNPPKDVLVLVTPTPVDGASTWPAACHRLLIDDGFTFDLLRDQTQIPMENGFFVAFGGDAAPLFNEAGFASVRLLRKEADGIGLVLQVGHQYAGVPAAQAAVKEFFGLFDEDTLVVCQKYGSVFGAA